MVGCIVPSLASQRWRDVTNIREAHEEEEEEEGRVKRYICDLPNRRRRRKMSLLTDDVILPPDGLLRDFDFLRRRYREGQQNHALKCSTVVVQSCNVM